MRSYRLRDRWLSGVAPISLLLQLTAYAIFLILTLGAMIWGFTDLDWVNALYQAGSTFTTLGIVEPVNVMSTIVALCAAFLGLVVIAVFIGFLLGIFSMYNDRENLMARLAAVAGEPAWGPEILARSALLGAPLSDAIDSADWLDWTVRVRTNTLINPTFALFRSPSPHSHWAISQLAILDAVALKLAIEPGNAAPVDIRLLSGGTVTCGLLVGKKTHNWRTEEKILAVLSGSQEESDEKKSAGLTDDEWGIGWSELVRCNVVDPADEFGVRTRFNSLRQLYFDDAYLLASRHHAVRAPWSGARPRQERVVMPERASELKGQSQ
jgi:hypothetical protein